MKTLKCMLLSAAFVTFVSCGSNGQNNSDSQNSADTAAESSVQKMQNYESGGKAEFNGVTYSYVIKREAVDSLSEVTDNENHVYADNRITLIITNDATGATVLSKTYKKGDFAATVADNNLMEHSVLLGIVFSEVKLGGLGFIVSVGDPTVEDLYMPMELVVAPNGSTSLSRAVEMDGAPEKSSIEGYTKDDEVGV